MTRGLQSAGFYVIGVDNVQRDRYIGDDFILGDALVIGRSLISRTRPALILGSPPCGSYSALRVSPGNKLNHGLLIPGTRAIFKASGIPYVIENVAGAPVRKDVRLCGEMFGLSVLQHRYFELGGWQAASPPHPRHRGRVRGWRHGVWSDGPYIAAYGKGGGKGEISEIQSAKGIYWTNDRVELCEAIPPAYGQWIGERFLECQA